MPESESGSPVDPVERLADLLNRLEEAQDNVKAAHRAQTVVSDEIKAELGLGTGYTNGDKLTVALLRALVKARKEQRDA